MIFAFNAFFFFSLVPYISFFVYPSDVQPISFIIGFLILLFVFDIKKFDFLDLLFILFGILCFSYIDPNWKLNFSQGLSSADYSYSKRIAGFFAFIIFYLVRYYHYLLNPKVVTFALFLNLFFVFVNILTPVLYNEILGLITREVKINFTYYVGPRGYSGLCIEPTYLAGFALVCFNLNEFFFKKNKTKKNIYIINMFIVFALIFLSKSVTGLFFLFIILLYLIYSNFKFYSKYILVLSIIFLSLTTLLAIEIKKNEGIPGNNRAIKYINYQLINNDQYSKIFQDISMMRRAVPIMTSLFIFEDNIFGNGGGSYPELAYKYIDKTKKYFDHNSKNFKYVKINGKSYPIFTIKNPSAFSLYLTHFGIFFIIFLIFLYYSSNRKILMSVSSFLFILFSFSFITPFIWILIGLLNAKNINEKLKHQSI